ncbi:hypothetical protein [Chondromyces apiculatus]|uniref:Uncharacterized protein n=1 Tax=Chondromyces apiculatus DSM 436 TaxID=1192034 RepID=A0A017TCT9_9BACT|nr:hypothetical protein [Chondromyces apiculatus]EYF06747.1 Hypothetical protein CAP_1444 [Chondromyces apiculatus DSM 436]
MHPPPHPPPYPPPPPSPYQQPHQQPHQQPYPPPPYAPQPRKLLPTGCVVVLAVVGVLVLGFVAVMAFGSYLFVTSKPGKEIIDIVGKGAKVVGGVAQVFEDAKRAPGTNEVRALGCDGAMALDVNEVLAAFNQFDAGLPTTTPKVSLMVVCSMNGLFAKPPDCDAVARAYLSGAGAPAGNFAATVTLSDRKSSNHCSMEYAPSGARVGPFAGSIPVAPPSPTSP